MEEQKEEQVRQILSSLSNSDNHRLHFDRYPLEVLDFSFFSWGVLEYRVSHCPNLRELRFPNEKISIKISNCPKLEELKLSEKMTDFDIYDCPALKELKLTADVKKVNLSSNVLSSSNTLDITQSLRLENLKFGDIRWENVSSPADSIKQWRDNIYREEVIKFKVIFNKSQRNKNICYDTYAPNNGYYSLNFLIERGWLKNYEERN